MKSILQSTPPYPPIVDLTHEVPPQNEVVGVFLLEYCYPDLPEEAIILFVVDPMVGTDRDIIAVKTESEKIVIAPDRKLVDGLDIDEVYVVEEPPISSGSSSSTFHGRDWFAPTGRFLSTGGRIEDLGSKIPYQSEGSIVPTPDYRASKITGEVIYIDKFGNLITNIPEKEIPVDQNKTLELGNHQVEQFFETYAQHSGLICLVGSFNRLEIAKPGGSAKQHTGVEMGNKVELTW